MDVLFDNVLYSPRVIITPVRRHDHSVTERDVATSERPGRLRGQVGGAKTSALCVKHYCCCALLRTRRSAHAQHDNNDAGELHNPKMWVDTAALIIAVAIPLAVGFTGTAVGGGGQSVWYKELNKPSWMPPDWLFPVMWTALYVLMGIASWLIWEEGGFKGQSYPLAAYIFQLLLNFLWTPIFFGMRRPDLGLVEIVVLWLAIVVTIYLFWHVNTIAAYLLVPYILWVTIATALNWYIWVYNGQAEQEITEPLHHTESV